MPADKPTAPLGDGDGTPVSVPRPAQEAQSVAHALRRLTSHIGLVLENISDAIIQFDADGRVLWASPSLHRIFGYDDEAVVGTHLRFEHPDDAAQVSRTIVERMAVGEDVIDTRGRALCADGSVLWAASRTRVVRTAGGEVDYIVVTVRDVTERPETVECGSNMLAGVEPATVLRCVAASLEPGGGCVFTVLNGYALARGATPESVAAGDFDPLALAVRTEITSPDPSAPPLRERGFVPTELILLFDVVGLAVDHLWGGTAGSWGRRPPELDEIELMVVAHRPASVWVRTVYTPSAP